MCHYSDILWIYNNEWMLKNLPIYPVYIMTCSLDGRTHRCPASTWFSRYPSEMQFAVSIKGLWSRTVAFWALMRAFCCVKFCFSLRCLVTIICAPNVFCSIYIYKLPLSWGVKQGGIAIKKYHFISIGILSIEIRRSTTVLSLRWESV